MNKNDVLKLKNPLTPQNVYVGQYVWLNREAANNLDYCFTEAETNSKYGKVEEGLYRIIKINTNIDNPPNLASQGRIAMELFIVRDESIDKDPIFLTINECGDVVLDGFLLIEGGLSAVIRNLEELKKANNERFECVSCNKKLNIVFTNLRICKDCEEAMLNGTLLVEDSEQQDEDFFNDGPTPTLRLPWNVLP
jgi:hypothetical protein